MRASLLCCIVVMVYVVFFVCFLLLRFVISVVSCFMWSVFGSESL